MPSTWNLLFFVSLSSFDMENILRLYANTVYYDNNNMCVCARKSLAHNILCSHVDEFISFYCLADCEFYLNRNFVLKYIHKHLHNTKHEHVYTHILISFACANFVTKSKKKRESQQQSIESHRPKQTTFFFRLGHATL